MISESTTALERQRLRLVIAGGGTGGHVMPALAVLAELRDRVDLDVLWIGSRTGSERQAAEQADVAFASIPVGKLRRYISWRTPIDAALIPIGIAQAWWRLRAFKPDVVFSTGGYVSTPTVVAASRRKIPILTHEQTATIGLATKLNARFADVVALSYPSSAGALGDFRAKSIVTGNPVRRQVLDGNADAGRTEFGFTGDLPLVYVTGGMLGAEAINNAIASGLPELLPSCQVLHQCGGPADESTVKTLQSAAAMLPDELRERYRVVRFVGAEIGDVLAAADVVVGRAGAGTVTELGVLGKRAILIPLPSATEQRLNAEQLAEQGFATVIDQGDVTPTTLVNEILLKLATSLESVHNNPFSLHTTASATLASMLLDLAND